MFNKTSFMVVGNVNYRAGQGRTVPKIGLFPMKSVKIHRWKAENLWIFFFQFHFSCQIAACLPVLFDSISNSSASAEFGRWPRAIHHHSVNRASRGFQKWSYFLMGRSGDAAKRARRSRMAASQLGPAGPPRRRRHPWIFFSILCHGWRTIDRAVPDHPR